MKNTFLATILVALSATVLTAHANIDRSFGEQLMMQKTQLHPQEFNFISDRYKQVQVQKTNGLSFKTQLDSQKEILRDVNFYPVVGMSFDMTAEKPSFKAQLDSQKDILLAAKFYPVVGMSFITTAQ